MTDPAPWPPTPVILYGTERREHDREGADVEITLTPRPRDGETGPPVLYDPSEVDPVERVDLYLESWTTRPLARSGVWAILAVPSVDFPGYDLTIGDQTVWVQIAQADTDQAVTDILVAALAETARLTPGAERPVLTVDQRAPMVHWRDAVVTIEPTPVPPAGYLDAEQVGRLIRAGWVAHDEDPDAHGGRLLPDPVAVPLGQTVLRGPFGWRAVDPPWAAPIADLVAQVDVLNGHTREDTLPSARRSHVHVVVGDDLDRPRTHRARVLAEIGA